MNKKEIKAGDTVQLPSGRIVEVLAVIPQERCSNGRPVIVGGVGTAGVESYRQEDLKLL